MRAINKPVILVPGLLSAMLAGPAAAQTSAGEGNPVGQPPPETEATQPVDIPAVPAEVGGVLTPQGHLILEPSLQLAHASVNRLTFEGIEIISPVLIGLFSAEDIDQDIVTAAMTARFGITNRFELEVKVPYVYRRSTQNLTVPVTQSNNANDRFSVDQETSGDGLGDIELALHYQLNDGAADGAYYIANIRFKSITGEGPFDIDRDADGIAEELPTGSGFYSIEPSVTILFPSAPAVYFANFGYVLNLEDDVDEDVGDTMIGTVDPGDAIRVSFGMAYAINPKTSFTLGYKHDYIFETETQFLGAEATDWVTVESRELSVGSLLLGWAYQIDEDVAFNLNLELGVTDDATDTVLTLRMPFDMTVF